MEYVSSKYDVLGFFPLVGTVSGIVGIVKASNEYNEIVKSNLTTPRPKTEFSLEKQKIKAKIIRRVFELVPLIGPLAWSIGFVFNKIFSSDPKKRSTATLVKEMNGKANIKNTENINPQLPCINDTAPVTLEDVLDLQKNNNLLILSDKYGYDASSKMELEYILKHGNPITTLPYGEADQELLKNAIKALNEKEIANK